MRRLLAAAVLVASLLSGCGEATAIDSRALVVALAVDKAKSGNLRFTFQVPSPQSLGGGGAGSGGNSFYYPSAEAKSFADAISKVEDRTSRDIYLGQLHMILVAMDLTPQERDRFLREEQRLGEMDHAEWVAFASPSAAKLLPPPPDQEELPAMFYATHFSCRACQSASLGIEAWRVSKDLMSPGRTATLPVVKMETGQYVIETVASFVPGGKPVEFSRKETQAIMLSLGKMYKGVVDVQTTLGSAIVRSLHAKTRRAAALDAQGRLHFSLRASLDGTIDRAPARSARLTSESTALIAQSTAQRVELELAAAIRKAQVSGVDPFRFASALYLGYPDAERGLGDFAAAFRGARVSVQVQVTLPHKGMTV